VPTPSEGSIKGRGKEELLPERGDPFMNQQEASSNEDVDETLDVLPMGIERGQNDYESAQSNGALDYEMPRPDKIFREDVGMQAIGPPLPDDLRDESIPPPLVEPGLPPPPDCDMSTLIQEQNSIKITPIDEAHGIRTSTGSFDPKMDNLLVSELRWKKLHAKADLLRERMSKEVQNPHLRKLLSDQIGNACDGSLKTRDEFEESERILNEVEGRIQLEKQVQKWSTSLKSWIFIYELIFLILFIVGLFIFPKLVSDLTPSWFTGLSTAVLSDVTTMINAMMWGGLGGIVSAFIGLWAHHALDQDIDRQWAIWFFVNPLMGIGLGALIFLLLRALWIGLFPSTLNRFEYSWILYALSCIAGFKQNVFFDLVERGMKLLEPKKKA